VKVAVFGGSAPSTPHLLTEPRLAHDPSIAFALHGRDPRRLAGVRRAAIALEPALADRITVSTDLATVLDGADAVVVQARPGGLAARAHDERFPLAENIPGDEGLGPGGLAAAWRAWPVVREILAQVACHAPHARVAILTAPLGILVRCALDAFPALHVVGLCELPAVVLSEIEAALGVPALQFAYAGVNHLGWFTELRAGERDAIDAYAAAREGAPYPSAAVIRASRAVPLPYVRLIDERDAVVAAQRAAQRTGTARATVLADIAAGAHAAFELGDGAAIRSVLARRSAPWYARAVAPWILAQREAGERDVFFLTVRNAGHLAGFADDAVVEVPHRVRGGALVAEPPHVPPPAIARLLHALVAYEKLAATAVGTRDEAAMTCALAAHPWVADDATAARLAPGVLDEAAIAPATAPA
jgi:6-phospho-beta-glucosidase